MHKQRLTTLPTAPRQRSYPSYDEFQRGVTLTPPRSESHENFQVWNVDAIASDAEKGVLETRVDSNVGRTPPDPKLRMTGSMISALCELPKQGWEWTGKVRSMSSIESGALFLLPETQQATPPLVVTDAIIRAFHELREQGWEIHLEPMKCDNLERPAE